MFTYLDAFCTDEHFAEFLPDYANLEEMKAHYRRGGLGDGTCKKFLFNVLEETLAPIRAERARWAKDIDTVYDILVAGTAKAVETTNETLAQVRKAMRIDYFTDRSIVKEWRPFSARPTSDPQKGTTYPMKNKREGWVLKFTLFSISAGAIEMASFAALLNELLHGSYWPCYLIALTLSVLWNFTLNRKFTFQSANNVPQAMALVLLYYCAFTPLSTLLGSLSGGYPPLERVSGDVFEHGAESGHGICL